MAFNEELAQRVRAQFETVEQLTERKMFGGLAFLVNGHMACGIVGDELMVRVGPTAYEEALQQKHTRPLDFTGKPMRGMLFVEPAGIKTARQLGQWVGRGVDFVLTLPAKDAQATKAKKSPPRC